MTKVTADEIMRALRQAPKSTPKQLAERIGKGKANSIASRLNKWAHYGMVDREWDRVPNTNPPHKIVRYSVKHD